MAEIIEHAGRRYERTGEIRFPKKGEMFISSNGLRPLRALIDFTGHKHEILRELPAEKAARPPFETFTGPTCKGCYALGSACGTCEKCPWEQAQPGFTGKPTSQGVREWCGKCEAWKPCKCAAEPARDESYWIAACLHLIFCDKLVAGRECERCEKIKDAVEAVKS